ncbi:hypothetical protein Tco_0683773 [Tanacetum coccineum]
MNPKVRYTGSCSGNHGMACLASLDVVDGLDGTERGYQELCLGELFIMGEPLSPDRVFDFPMDEPEPHPAYDFFTLRPLLGADGHPSCCRGRVAGDRSSDRYGGGLSQLFGDDNFSDDDSEGFEDEEEVWEVNEEWLMAPVTPLLMPVMPPSSTYEVGGPSTAVAEGHSLALLAPGAPMPPSVIEDLCTRMGNLEHGHGLLVKKVIKVVGRLEQVGTQMEQGQQAATQRDKTVEGLSQQVQTLQAAMQQRDVQIQQLQTMMVKMSSRESTLMQCILGMDRRLADLVRRPPGPQ